MPSASAAIEVDTPPGVLMDVILDFASYPSFLPEVEEARVMRHTADAWEIGLALRVIRPLRFTIRAERTDEHTLRWALIEGRLHENDGAWTLTPLDDGARCHVRWTADVQVGLYLPGGLIRTLTTRRLPATLSRFRERAESRWSAPTRSAPV